MLFCFFSRFLTNICRISRFPCSLPRSIKTCFKPVPNLFNHSFLHHDQGFDPSLSCNPTRTDAYFQTDAAKLATPPPPSTNRGPNGGGGNGNDNSESEVSYALIDRAECCGEYPIRFKYHTIDSNGGDRSCCGPDSNGIYKTYNSNLLECCATGDVTGDVKPVGDC